MFVSVICFLTHRSILLFILLLRFWLCLCLTFSHSCLISCPPCIPVMSFGSCPRTNPPQAHCLQESLHTVVPLVSMIHFFIHALVHSFPSNTSDNLILSAYGWPLTSVCVSFQVRSLRRRRKPASCVNIPVARNTGSLPRWGARMCRTVQGNPLGATQTGTL